MLRFVKFHIEEKMVEFEDDCYDYMVHINVEQRPTIDLFYDSIMANGEVIVIQEKISLVNFNRSNMRLILNKVNELKKIIWKRSIKSKFASIVGKLNHVYKSVKDFFANNIKI